MKKREDFGPGHRHNYKAEGNDPRGTWGYCSCGKPMYKPTGKRPRVDPTPLGYRRRDR